MAKIEVNGKEYNVTLATNDEEREKGLQGLKELPEDEGMLFVFEEPQNVSFWMQDTYVPLDIIFIDEYGEVISVAEGEPESEEPHEEANVKYVLEVNLGSGINAGDDVDLGDVESDWDTDDSDSVEDEDGEEERVKMLVLDEKGKAQMELNGGERIFSRPNTKTLVKLSKRAYKSKLEKDYKALGKKVFKYLDIQNNKEEDYVELP